MHMHFRLDPTQTDCLSVGDSLPCKRILHAG